VKRKISDLDKRALEAAIRLREKHGGEVIALTVGAGSKETTMLEALSIGADSAHIVSEDILKGIDSLVTSKIIDKIIGKIGDFDLIICGEMTLDSLSSQVGPRIGELLGLPQVTYARNIEIEGDVLKAERDLDVTVETVKTVLPALVTVVREINEPRIPSLMNIMKAKRKPSRTWTLNELGFSPEEILQGSSVEILRLEAPLVKRRRIKIEAETLQDAAEKLAHAILTEGGIDG
jgi:electron transfer flavoprotein beta subunit